MRERLGVNWVRKWKTSPDVELMYIHIYLTCTYTLLTNWWISVSIYAQAHAYMLCYPKEIMCLQCGFLNVRKAVGTPCRQNPGAARQRAPAARDEMSAGRSLEIHPVSAAVLQFCFAVIYSWWEEVDIVKAGKLYWLANGSVFLYTLPICVRAFRYTAG